MPDMRLTREEADAIASSLIFNTTPDQRAVTSVTKRNAASGRRQFERFNCGSCHTKLAKAASVKTARGRPFSKLNPNRGCLADRPPRDPNEPAEGIEERPSRPPAALPDIASVVPAFRFSKDQLAAMRAAIRSPVKA